LVLDAESEGGLILSHNGSFRALDLFSVPGFVSITGFVSTGVGAEGEGEGEEGEVAEAREGGADDGEGSLVGGAESLCSDCDVLLSWVVWEFTVD